MRFIPARKWLAKLWPKASPPTKPKKKAKPPPVPRPYPPAAMRMYAAARTSRLNATWGQSTTSEDHELATSLVKIRNRSRESCRDSAYAKRAKTIVQSNVVGPGIGMQARIQTTRYTLKSTLNDAIEAAWLRWCDATQCHIGGALHFCEFERQCMGQVFEAGEIFIRKHYKTMDGSRVPLCLELIESERIADDFQGIPAIGQDNSRLGIEIDDYFRPTAYWIRTMHPTEIRFTHQREMAVERVPASDIFHLRIIDRWPQTRGVPWLHATMRRLNDMDGLGESEILAARAAACYMGFIEMPNSDIPYGEKQPQTGMMMEELSPAVIQRLNAGEKFTFAAPNRPNAQLDAFMRLMLREVAAGVGASYESLSRDYSQSNYSSSRLALLDDRDLWRMLQRWFIRSFREPLHREWLSFAVMSGAIPGITVEEYALDPERFEAVRFKPRGWNWVDPTKEVAAYKDAIRCGFTTVSRVIEQTGNGDDLEDILTEREEELAWMHEKGLVFDTDPQLTPSGNPQTLGATENAPTEEEPANGNEEEGDEEGEEEEADAAVAYAMVNSNGHHHRTYRYR